MRIAVVAHESRAEHAYPLAQQLNASILMDDGTLGGKANHLRAWTAVSDSDWGVVLEDDAILCADFLTELNKALSDAPSPIVSLYLGTSYPPHLVGNARRALEAAEAVGERFCMLPTLNHAVAVAVRGELIPDMIAGASSTKRPIDEAITHWARGIGISYTVPSLVDHRDEETVTNHPDGVTRTRPRKAVRFLGNTLSSC